MSKMNPELWELAKKLAARTYDINISKDETAEGHIYVAENPELLGCMAQGRTLIEAIKELNEGRIDFIYFLLEDGLEVPKPQPTKTSTGVNTVKNVVSFPTADSNSNDDYPVVDLMAQNQE